MPKTYYCWRCRIPVPMLTEDEWLEIEPILTHDLERIKRYREEKNVGLSEALAIVRSEACEKFFEMTGFRETNRNAIYHHRLSKYGPECSNCGHLIRTSQASFCASCGALTNV